MTLNRFVSILSCCFPLVISNVLHAENTSKIFYRTFWNPILLTKPLAYCEAPKTNCGAPTADQYCKSMGYLRSTAFKKAHNVGESNYIAARKTCIGWDCDSFMFIRCEGEIAHDKPESYHYRLRQYAFPRYNHYRIDWCYQGKQGCGQKAADSFCRREGYMEARSFQIDEKANATKALGNQALCFGKQCHGFSSIECYR